MLKRTDLHNRVLAQKKFCVFSTAPGWRRRKHQEILYCLMEIYERIYVMKRPYCLHFISTHGSLFRKLFGWAKTKRSLMKTSQEKSIFPPITIHHHHLLHLHHLLLLPLLVSSPHSASPAITDTKPRSWNKHERPSSPTERAVSAKRLRSIHCSSAQRRI